MREIKFRCWDTENKEMLEVQELDYENSYNGQPMVRPDMYNDYFDTEEMILMQYTGLHDKNGVEIYEGDIVKCSSINTRKILIVKFYDGCFILVDKYDEHFEDSEILFNYMPIGLEVIGNIYNNPELLEKGEVTDE